MGFVDEVGDGTDGATCRAWTKLEVKKQEPLGAANHWCVSGHLHVETQDAVRLVQPLVDHEQHS